MRIGIDIDGVLTDVERWQLDYGSKFFYEKYNKNIVNHKGYEMTDIFDVSPSLDDEVWKKYLLTYAREEKPRKFADEIINKLKQEGNEIYIITARCLTDRNDELGVQMKEIVINWLKQNNINYDKIIFSPEDKVDICLENNINLMIEDKVDNITKISKHIPVICFHANYNEICSGENIIRCYSWYDIYRNIKNMCE